MTHPHAGIGATHWHGCGCAVKERPILFSGPMVRAILEGRKSQTRRVVKPQPKRLGWNEGVFDHGEYRETIAECPYGQPGDRLWVRESAAIIHPNGPRMIYRADAIRDDSGERDGWWFGNQFIAGDIRWRPSIHMPRLASRITLEITGVRVEMVQEISEEDASAEGVAFTKYANANARFHFKELWDSLNAARGFGWEKNPWVWCIDFRRINQ